MGIIPWVGCRSASQSLRLKGNTMNTNVGGIDRVARITIGLVLVGLAAIGTLGPWAWLGVLPLATGLVGWCPPYAMLGWSTCSTKKSPQ